MYSNSNIDYEGINKRLKAYADEKKIILPYRNSTKYIRIEEFPEYEYTNCIAFNMLCRNKEFNNKIKKQSFEQESDEELILNFGLDPRFNSYMDYGSFLFNSNFFLVEKHTIRIINHGLERLIHFYYKNQLIYMFKDEEYIKIDCNKISLFDISNNLSQYYIECESIYTINKIKIMKNINVDLELDYLNKNFLKEIGFLDTKYQYTHLVPNYSCPYLEFPQSNVVNIPVNLNLDKDEIVSYILQAKKEFDSGKLIIKTPIESIECKFEKEIKLKSNKIFPKENLKKRKAYATAFYIYDLHKIFEENFKIKIEELNIQREKDIKINPTSSETRIIIQEKYNDNLKHYSKSEIKIHIGIILDLNLDTVERYYKFMIEHIENKKYIELITGKSSINSIFEI
ncbi:hypothetical protein NG755_03280 [Aliarcobacter cryaerophilus]|uniref:hypothetical protein n=1 Tax=Aliarcobacter cryaerophilus TaxID=28198 RepID=UPI003DA60C76